jgi:pyruvate formate lyase activating enzyme
MGVECRLYETSNGKVRCLVCQHKCVILEGERGICRKRINLGGKLFSPTYMITKESVELIEQKPLFHFWPNSVTYSIGGISCNFDCPWCQNWSEATDFVLEFAQLDATATRDTTPEKVVDKITQLGVNSITYTYNEPSVWFEFICETAKLAKSRGIHNILMTNGYYSSEALDQYAGLIDAVSIDIKSFTDEFYRKYANANLQPILEMAQETKRKGIHVELSMLLIPTLSDGMEDIKRFISWVLNEMGPDTPVHFSRFFPRSNFTHLPQTPLPILAETWQAAREAGLHYVYVENVPGVGRKTLCPGCGTTVIGRDASQIREWHLDEKGMCSKCGTKIPIVGRYIARSSDSTFVKMDDAPVIMPV